jgi:endonuclease-3
MKKKTQSKKPKPGRPKREGPGERIVRARKILAELKKIYSDADCALSHKSPLELLVATILSAQCTDERVNKVTPALFDRYKSAEEFSKADPAELETIIKSTGFFRNKTKSIIGAGRIIVERFNGRVPETMEELLAVPGVARKTANVVLGTWFEKSEGVVVDTHVGRLAHRLGFTWSSRDEKDAVKIEKDLMEILPRESWTFVAHALILHGRAVCGARKPECGKCTLAKLCPSAHTFGPPRGKK